MFGKKKPTATYKEYPDPPFPSDKARAAYRRAQRIIKDAWEWMQAGEVVTSLENALASEGLTALPPEIGQLTALTGLSLYNNQLTALPPEIGQLTALTRLRFSNNQLTALPPEIGRLTALTVLTLYNNQLTALPPEIGQLTALTELYLDNNQLTALPPEIGRLTALTELCLSGNQLTALPPEMRNLTKLRALYLHGNDALGLPPEVLGKTFGEAGRDHEGAAEPAGVLDYYFRTRVTGQPLHEVKVMLVGRGGAGKTSVVRRLVDKDYREGEPETPGISITDAVLTCEGAEIKTHFWDFAGQEITHGTHQFFFTRRCLYVLLLTGREGTEMQDADYWLRMIRAFGGEAPVLVVLNKMEDHPFEVDEQLLREQHPGALRVVGMDCRSGAPHWREDLLAALCGMIAEMESVRTFFPAEWMAVKNRLSGMEEDYMDLGKYRGICAENKVTEEKEQDELAGWLHALGIALNYADDARVRHALVLNPRWITNGIYTLLRATEKAVPTGELRLALAEKVLPLERPEMRRYLVDLMQKYELCFALPEVEDAWLVPAALPVRGPALSEGWHVDPEAVRLYYQYEALPHGVMARFIVRTHVLSRDHERWRHGVVLAREGATALVRAFPARDRIELTLRGPAAEVQRLAAAARAQFEIIHRDLAGLKPVEWIEVQADPRIYERVAFLMGEEKKPGPVTVSSDVGSVVVDETAVLNKVEPEALRKHPPEHRVAVFVSYAHKNNALKELLDVNLSILAHQKLIEPWTDARIQGGEAWSEVIERQLRGADVILFLVSREFLASDYIRYKEIPVALEQMEKTSAVIVPVLLHDYKSWTKEAGWGHLNPLPAWGKPVEGYPTAEEGFDAVDEELRKVIARVAAKKSGGRAGMR